VKNISFGTNPATSTLLVAGEKPHTKQHFTGCQGNGLQNRGAWRAAAPKGDGKTAAPTLADLR
jgi:hypothetical protein